MKKGDVVLISFPFTDLTSVKVRPALVISNDSYNEVQDDIVLLLITSNVPRLSSDGYLLESKIQNLQIQALKNPQFLERAKYKH